MKTERFKKELKALGFKRNMLNFRRSEGPTQFHMYRRDGVDSVSFRPSLRDGSEVRYANAQVNLQRKEAPPLQLLIWMRTFERHVGP